MDSDVLLFKNYAVMADTGKCVAYNSFFFHNIALSDGMLVYPLGDFNRHWLRFRNVYEKERTKVRHYGKKEKDTYRVFPNSVSG